MSNFLTLSLSNIHILKIKIMSKSKKISITHRPLADMHADGVRFDPKIKEALKNERKLDKENPAKR